MKVSRWQIHFLSMQFQIMTVILPQVFQNSLHLDIGLVMMHIQKIKMILHHKFTPVKNGVMMVGRVKLDALFFSQQSICFRLFPKLPDINVSTRSMFRSRLMDGAGISFQHHHFETIRIMPPCHLCNSSLIQLIAVLVFLQRLTNPI